MSRKREKAEYPDDWDVAEETQGPDDIPPPFETVAVTQDSDKGGENGLSHDLVELTVTEVPVQTRNPQKPSPKRRKESEKVTPTSKKRQVRPQRKKSAGTIKEKAFKKGKGYCCVVCRLNTICKDSCLVEEIKRTARAMKQIQMGAWHLVNLHSLRCLEHGLPLPDCSNKTFFDHCCAGVATTAQTHLIEQKNPELWKSIQVFQSQQSRSGFKEVSYLTGYSELKQELREQMVVNAGVMIREHFFKRLCGVGFLTRITASVAGATVVDAFSERRGCDWRNTFTAAE